MKVLSLFDGISCGKVALENIGIANQYYASEIDAHAIQVSNHNYSDIIQLGNVNGINKTLFSDSIDLLIGGSPCQGFSPAGFKKGLGDDRSILVFEYLRLLNELNPKYFLLENTRMPQDCKNLISRELGVSPILINSSLVCAQNRPRLYWTNIPFEEHELLKDDEVFLEDIVGPYEGIYVRARGNNKGGTFPYKGKAPCITSSSWHHNFFITLLDGEKRSFTPEEAEILQTIPPGYTSIIKKTKRFSLIGNAWTVKVIERLFQGLLK